MPSHLPSPPPNTDPFLAVIYEVLRIHGRIRRLFRDVEQATGLSNMELAVLSSIAEARASQSAAQIGRALGHPRQVVQRAANALAAQNLIEARHNPADRRAPVLIMTPEGAAMKTRADETAIAVASRVSALLKTPPRETLPAELRSIRQAIDAHIKAPRDCRTAS